MSENKQAYISRVHLKGYKSIKDLEIDLKPGLNIIIGPNGSGKTNFINSLNEILLFILNPDSYYEWAENNTSTFLIEITDEKNTHILDIKIKDFEIEKYGFNSFAIDYTYKELNSKTEYSDTMIYNLHDRKYEFSLNKNKFWGNIFYKGEQSFSTPKLLPELISYNNPYNSEPFDNGFSIKTINTKSGGKRLVNNTKLNDGTFSRFSYLLLYNYSWFTFYVNEFILDDFIRFNPKIRENLMKYTNIQDVKIIKDRIREYKEGNETIYDNILLQFLINNNWLYWSQLSDGTKRLFYIIFQIFTFEQSDTILLEEPELGIHPHQLIKLMQFLKEQAKEKQIIITTHSPEVLNALDFNELDRIIVTKYDNEKGTTMSHLSEEDQRKIEKGCKEKGLFISDYWVNMDVIEKQDEEVEV